MKIVRKHGRKKYMSSFFYCHIRLDPCVILFELRHWSLGDRSYFETGARCWALKPGYLFIMKTSTRQWSKDAGMCSSWQNTKGTLLLINALVVNLYLVCTEYSVNTRCVASAEFLSILYLESGPAGQGQLATLWLGIVRYLVISSMWLSTWNDPAQGYFP